MDIWSNPLKPDCMKCTQWELMSRHVQSEWLLFPPLLARVEPGSTSPRMAPLTNLVSESERAQVHFMDAGRRPNPRFQRPSGKALQTPKISFENGIENMLILIKSRAIITRLMYCTFAIQCSSFIKWFLTNHKWRHVRRDLVFSSQIK